MINIKTTVRVEVCSSGTMVEVYKDLLIAISELYEKMGTEEVVVDDFGISAIINNALTDGLFCPVFGEGKYRCTVGQLQELYETTKANRDKTQIPTVRAVIKITKLGLNEAKEMVEGLWIYDEKGVQ